MNRRTPPLVSERRHAPPPPTRVDVGSEPAAYDLPEVDLLQEERLALGRAARDCNVHIATIGRWCQRGIRSVVLESYLLGGRRYTTRQALTRFVERRSSIGTRVQPGASALRSREAAVKQAERELREEGL